MGGYNYYMSKRPNLFCFVLPTEYRTRMNEIIEDEGLSASEIMRHAFKLYYEQWEKKTYGYGKGKFGKTRLAKQEIKESREESIKKLETMTDEELSQHLIDIGFSAPDKVERIFGNITSITHYGVEVDPETQERAYHCWVVDKDQKISSHSRIMGWDQLIKKLIKEKFI